MTSFTREGWFVEIHTNERDTSFSGRIGLAFKRFNFLVVKKAPESQKPPFHLITLPSKKYCMYNPRTNFRLCAFSVFVSSGIFKRYGGMPLFGRCVPGVQPCISDSSVFFLQSAGSLQNFPDSLGRIDASSLPFESFSRIISGLYARNLDQVNTHVVACLLFIWVNDI